ncbi:FAD-binding oxidoreductase [Actinotalea sp. K2]|uniref:FAD-binding oxidoreductase n=1 Tax=Actinotalea sp. K2 TaxID=2939438 RepID=UPI0020172C7A|nr:FAD-binding protein [Actinotalea sp. K2]MCL3861247.1 FAD-binding protein [Actinotalea sp. K2]
MTTRTAESPSSRGATLRRLGPAGLHLPGDPGYAALSTPWNTTVEQRPAAVVDATCTHDVVAAVRAATAAGLRVAPQATGHNAGPLGSLADVLLLRTAGMTGVSLSEDGRSATVGAGTLWLDVVDAASGARVSVRHGSSPDVGVVGYSVGGGIGWYARRHGLQSSHLTAAEMVLADGSVARVDSREPELLWALRGGGGNLGVITELTFDTLPFTTCVAGMLAWDVTHAATVIPAWLEWTQDAPELASTSLQLLQLPPFPEVPAPLRGRRLVAVIGALLTDDDAAAGLLAALRAHSPELDTFTRTPTPALVRLSMDPEGPTPVVTGSSLVTTPTQEGIDRLLAVAGPDADCSLPAVELVHLGGALARPADGALSTVPGELAVLAVGIAADAETAARCHQDVDRVTGALAPWATGGQYLNFVGGHVDVSSAYTPEAWDRLRRIRTALDPTGVLRANHEVPTLT